MKIDYIIFNKLANWNIGWGTGNHAEYYSSKMRIYNIHFTLNIVMPLIIKHRSMKLQNPSLQIKLGFLTKFNRMVWEGGCEDQKLHSRDMSAANASQITLHHLFPSTLRTFFLCFEALLSMSRFTFGGLEKQNEVATACEIRKNYKHKVVTIHDI